MKRILSFLSLMVLSLFTVVACSKADNSFAQELVDSIILNEENRAVEGDFGLISKLSRDGEDFPINWKSNSKYVVIADEADESTVSYKASVNRNVPEEQTVTLTATIEAKGGKASKDFNVLVQPYELYDFIEAYKFNYDGANLYGEYELDKEFKLPNAPEAAKIEWSTNKPELINIDNAAGKMTVNLKFEKVEATMTANWSYKDETSTKEYKVNVLQQTIYPTVKKPEVNTPYVYGIFQRNLDNTYLWFNGKIVAKDDHRWGGSTKKLEEAKEVYFEDSTAAKDAYNIYFMDGSAKKYLTVNDTKKFVLADQASNDFYWTWDVKHETVISNTKGADGNFVTYFTGTYNKFDTFSASDIDYINKDNQQIARFYKKSEIESAAPVFPDDQAVKAELEWLSIEDVKSGEYTLREQGRKVEKVDFTYALKEGAKNVKLEGNKLIVDKIYDNEETFVIIVTAQAGQAKATREITVKHEVSVKDLVTYGPATALDVNTTYKLGMHHGTLDKTVYFVGSMNGFYGASSEVAAEGVDINIVAVEGGYNLKFVDAKGATMYINAVLSKDGKHTNFVIEETASSVWTWDATNKTITTKLDGKDVFIGTRSDKTYTTFGLVSDPAKAFVANLYCEVKPHEIENPAVGAEYQLVMNHGGKQLFFTGAMSGFYGATTTEKAEAATVVLEATEGGFHVSFTVAGGDKQYINLAKSADGKHTNMKLEATATSVWTWDAANKTITTKVGEESFVLGTKKSGTYNTISVQPMSKAAENDLVGFFGFVEGTAPTPDPEPQPEPVLPVEKTIAEAKASANDTLVILTGKVIAVEATQYLIQDASGIIVVNTYNTEFTTLPALNDTVKVTGSKGSRNGADQVTLTAAFEKVADITVTEQVAATKTAEELKAFRDAEAHEAVNAIVEGKLVVSSKHINVYVNGLVGYALSPAIAADKLDALKALNGSYVKLTGYIYSGSGYGDAKYINMMVNAFEDITTDSHRLDFAEDDLVKILPDSTKVLGVNGEYLLKPQNADIKMVVTVNGAAFVYNEKTFTLTVTPGAEEVTNTLKIVYTLNDATKTFEYTLKTKVDNTPKDEFVFSTEYNKTATAITDGFKYVQGDASIEQIKNTSNNAVANTYPEMRVYVGHKLTISSSKTITKIVIETNSSKKFSELTVNTGEIVIAGTTTTWTGSATSVVIENAGNQGRVINVTVYYAA